MSAAEIKFLSSGGDLLLVLDGAKMSAAVKVNGVVVGGATDQFLRYTFSLKVDKYRPSSTTSPSYFTFRSIFTILFTLTPHERVCTKTASLVVGSNNVSITFDPQIEDTEGRWMACTGGWDWAAYSYNVSMGQSADGPSPARTLSAGLWRSVYIVPVRAAAIMAVVPLVFYTGAYPTSPLTDATAAPFNVSVRVHFWSPSGGTLCSIYKGPILKPI